MSSFGVEHGLGQDERTACDSGSPAADSASGADSTGVQVAPAVIRTLACLGDSITYGFGVNNPRRDAWPALLQDKLGASWNVVNLGVSGKTLSDDTVRPYRATGAIQRAKALDPTMAIITLGTNDAAEAIWDSAVYRDQLVALVDELVAASSCDVQIVLMAPPATFFFDGHPRHPQRFNEIIAGDLRAAVKSVAAEKGARYVDLHVLTENHPEWFPDYLHPNRPGNVAIADYVYTQLWQ